MSIRASAVLALFTLIGAGAVQSQAAAMPPKPGPEQEKLAYFVGRWAMEGTMQPGPMGPGGQMTGSETCEWFPGGFHVVCHSKGTGPLGATHGLGILGYNTEEKAYTYYGVDNSGYGGQGKGTTDGKTWVYTSEDKMGGKTIYGRYTMSDLAPDSYSFKWEMSEDNKTWNAVMEGKATRAAAKPAEKKEAAPKK